MNIIFYGAAHEVTGSCSLLETGGYRILVDCGMYQGGDFNEAKNHNPLPFNPKELTHVLVTHAHLDHVGRLPLLVKGGYTGHFYATKPTVELVELILRDALEVMTFDNKKFGKSVLYDSTDIAGVIQQFKVVEYEEKVTLPLDSTLVQVNFHDAGHIFGSAFIEIQAEGRKIVFSGDIGNVNVPILRDTEALPSNITALVCESTYGDRLHESSVTRQALIEDVVAEAIGRGGVLMIPSFSLERTQELIYDLNDLIDRKHRLPRIPIFLDSPLAINAFKVYRKYPKYYDQQAEHLVALGDDIFDFDGLSLTYTREQSMKINNTPGPKIIIAGSGMMNGGRIVHHALRYLSDERNTLLLIGYQSVGTLGRQILEGQSPVKVLGEEVAVRCHIKMIGALSAHGDQKKLLSWINGGKPQHVFLNHGDPQASLVLVNKLKEIGVESQAVEPGMNRQI